MMLNMIKMLRLKLMICYREENKLQTWISEGQTTSRRVKILEEKHLK